jgi:hypothetical protein
MQSKQTAMLLKDPFDAFGRKNFGEGNAFTTQKRIDNSLKTSTVTAQGIWYRYGHEKALLGFSPASEPRRASSLVPRLAYYRKITLAGPATKNLIHEL